MPHICHEEIRAFLAVVGAITLLSPWIRSAWRKVTDYLDSGGD